MSRKKYRQYSVEFKKEALQLLKSSGKSAAQIERDLDLTPGILYKWRARYEVRPNDEGGNNLEPSDIEAAKAEIRRLKKELETVKQEREIQVWLAKHKRQPFTSRASHHEVCVH